MADSKITGVVGILTDGNGCPIVTIADFDLSTYGGFTLAGSQKIRAKRDLARDAMHHLCNSEVALVIDSHRATEIVASLCAKKGWRQTYIEVETAIPLQPNPASQDDERGAVDGAG